MGADSDVPGSNFGNSTTLNWVQIPKQKNKYRRLIRESVFLISAADQFCISAADQWEKTFVTDISADCNLGKVEVSLQVFRWDSDKSKGPPLLFVNPLCEKNVHDTNMDSNDLVNFGVFD